MLKLSDGYCARFLFETEVQKELPQCFLFLALGNRIRDNLCCLRYNRSIIRRAFYAQIRYQHLSGAFNT